MSQPKNPIQTSICANKMLGNISFPMLNGAPKFDIHCFHLRMCISHSKVLRVNNPIKLCNETLIAMHCFSLKTAASVEERTKAKHAIMLA